MTGILFLFFSLWAGFLIEDKFGFLEKNFWAKVSFAIIVGSLLSTWLVFSLSLIIGFSRVSLWLSLVLIAAYISYARIRKRKTLTWFRQEVFVERSISPVHILLLLFIMPHFIFGVFKTETGDILYLGNYTDLSYHLSIVSAFIEQPFFLPESPQCAGAKMSYHFLVNFHSAILCLGGFDLFLSVIIPQIMFSFALATMVYCFYKLLLKNELSIFLSSSILILGHIAFFNLLFGLFGIAPHNMELDFTSWTNIKGLLLYPFSNFLDPVTNFFHPQRPFLFAFPLGLILLSGMYRMFLNKQADYKILFGLSLLLGITPLFHIHTFLVLAPVLVITAIFMRWDLKRTVVCLIPIVLAAVQILFILSQPKAPGFSGFDVHRLGGGLSELNILNSVFLSRIVFWIRAAGLPLILGIAGFAFYFIKKRAFSLRSSEGRENVILLIFSAVPFFFFLLINFYRFSPNWGDSNKFFLYLNVMLAFFAAKLLWAWFDRNMPGKICVILIILIAAIGPSVLKRYVVFSRSGSLLFSGCDRNVAAWIRLNTEKDAIFLTSDHVIHFVPALSGRRVVDGSYTWNTGFKKPGTERAVRRIYSTGNQRLIRKYNITHILAGPRERQEYVIGEQALGKFALIYDQTCGGKNYRIYEVHRKSTQGIKTHKGILKTNKSGGRGVFLSDLKPVMAIQDFRTLRFDANIDDKPIVLNGKRYAKGLGTHANSEIIFNLPAGYSYFESDIGLDDTEDKKPGSVIFEVHVDGKLKYKSPVMRWDSSTDHIRISIKGANELILIVDDAGDGDTCDHASWAGAMVY